MAADFFRSSHANHWLVDRRTLATARALDLKYATPQEIACIGIWSANAIQKITKRLNLRQQVTATATVFFKRFYLKSSYCETDLPLVAAACVYVAAKAEETAIHVKVVTNEARAAFQEYGIANFPTDTTKLAEMEFYLIEDLEFHLIVYHPYRNLIHMSGRDAGPLSKREIMMDMDDNSLQMAWFVLNDTYRSDLCLLYPPHLIAIASIYLSFSLHIPAHLFERKPPPIDTSSSSVASVAAANREKAAQPTGTAPASPVVDKPPTTRPPATASALSTASVAMVQSHSESSTSSGSTAAANAPAPGPSALTPATPAPPPAAPTPTPSTRPPQSNVNRGKTDPITFLASLNVQMPIVLEIIQEIISLYALWRSFEEGPAIGATAQAGLNDGSKSAGGMTPVPTGTPSSVGASTAAAGKADERIVALLQKMRANRETDLAHPAHAGQTN